MNAYIINTETMQWPIYEGDYRNMFSGDSLPTPLVLVDPYAWVQDTPQPEYDWVTQGVKEVTPVQQDGTWVRVWEVYGLSQEQIDANHQQQRNQNKEQATSLLSATDWTTIPDVADPAVSNPYLTNAAEFAAWRSQVRAIAVNPPTTPAVFPAQPTEQWSN